MSNPFKKAVLPLAKKHKFYFVIQDMDDEEIIEFIADEILGSTDFKTMSFEEAKAKCEKLYSVDKFIPVADQKSLFTLMQTYS